MKIGILSDIHVDLEHPQPEKVVDGMAAAIDSEGVDIMIIAGDVANDYRATLRTLNAIEKRSGARVLFVPGNHDIWNEHHPRMTAWEIYDALRDFPGNLANGATALDAGWVAVGDIGWYDYTFGGPQYTVEDFDRMQIGNRLWQDKVKSAWGRPTQEMHRYFRDKLEEQLRRYSAMRTLLITHAVPIRDFTVQPPDEAWNYLNAFLGSASYGELALKYGVEVSISGHVHYRRERVVGRTRFICNCLNYVSQWVENADPALEIRRALKTMVLD